MPCLIAFIGRHDSGKTTIIRKVVTELNVRGYTTGVIKSTHHNIDFHPPGRDTSLYRQDGIECVAVTGPEELAAFQDAGTDPLERTIFRLFPCMDIVLLEGFKHHAAVPKIEVAVNTGPCLYREVNKVKAVITQAGVKGIKVLDPDRTRELVDFLEYAFIREYMKEDEVVVFIGNRRLPMKYFIKNALKGLILGFLKALKFTQGAKKIDIKIVLR